MENTQGEIVLYQANASLQLPVKIQGENVRLNRHQLALLFDRDVKTIGKHINNALKEELADFSVIANFATTASDGKTYQMEYYNLDMILSVGYRVKSSNGIVFRKWASSILKNFVLK
jgi:hypothetical protein